MINIGFLFYYEYYFLSWLSIFLFFRHFFKDFFNDSKNFFDNFNNLTFGFLSFLVLEGVGYLFFLLIGRSLLRESSFLYFVLVMALFGFLSHLRKEGFI